MKFLYLEYNTEECIAYLDNQIELRVGYKDKEGLIDYDFNLIHEIKELINNRANINYVEAHFDDGSEVNLTSDFRISEYIIQGKVLKGFRQIEGLYRLL